MNRNRKRFRRILTTLRIASLIAIILALPLGFFSQDGYGIALEKTPPHGWKLNFLPEGISENESYICGILGSDLAIFSNQITPHVVPPVPMGKLIYIYGRYGVSDMSEFYSLGSPESIFGSVAVGRYSEGYPWLSTWNQMTGLMIPLWPLSLTAAILLVRMFYQKIKSRKILLPFCPTCYHDLRAHPAGSTCPECGTTVPSLPPSPK